MRRVRRRAQHAQAQLTGGGEEEEKVHISWDMPYANDCGHPIAITRRAGEDDGGRDFVLGVWAYGLRGEIRDHVPVN